MFFRSTSVKQMKMLTSETKSKKLKHRFGSHSQIICSKIMFLLFVYQFKGWYATSISRMVKKRKSIGDFNKSITGHLQTMLKRLIFFIVQNTNCLYLRFGGPNLLLGRTSFSGMLKVVLREPPFRDQLYSQNSQIAQSAPVSDSQILRFSGFSDSQSVC